VSCQASKSLSQLTLSRPSAVAERQRLERFSWRVTTRCTRTLRATGERERERERKGRGCGIVAEQSLDEERKLEEMRGCPKTGSAKGCTEVDR